MLHLRWKMCPKKNEKNYNIMRRFLLVGLCAALMAGCAQTQQTQTKKTYKIMTVTSGDRELKTGKSIR